MLLKNLIKLPEKTVFEEETRRKNTYETITDIINAGGNEMIEIIGNLEIELDVGKISKYFFEFFFKETSDGYNGDLLEKSHLGIKLVCADYAQKLSKNFKEIIK